MSKASQAEGQAGTDLQDASDLVRLALGSEAALDELLQDSPDAGFFPGAAALAPAEAVSLAVLSERDEALHAEGEFARWFPDPSAAPDVRRLAASARQRGTAMGLLETFEGGLVSAWAGLGEGAGRWARSAVARKALAASGRVLLLIFAPARSRELAARAAAAYGLTPLEARVAQALLFAPSIEIAAIEAGVGRETGRDALARIMAKTGTRRATDVVLRLAELMSAVDPQTDLAPEVFAEALGVTCAEAAVALQLAQGATQKEVADTLGLKPETVRTYARQILAKSGLPRAKDLARVAAETRALARLASVAEPVFDEDAFAQLRLMPRPRGRRLAFLDYGPRSGRPVVVFHGFVAGRSLPPALARGLQARGMRPIVPQRPGFGLTSPAAGDYLEQATDDLAALLDTLNIQRIALFARDGGTAAALHFAEAQPARIARGVLLNPRSPHGLEGARRAGPVSHLAQLMLNRPDMVGAVGEFIRRRTRSDLLGILLRRTLRAIPADRMAIEDDAVRAQLTRDIQAQFAHSAAGYVAEHQLYSHGWAPPTPRGGGAWTIVRSGGLVTSPSDHPWRGLPDVTFTILEDAGVLAQFTHAATLAALMAE